MSKTPVQLRQVDSALAKQLGSFVDLPKIDVPFTTILGRAKCVDFSNDLLPRMGVERIMVQDIQEVKDEAGPVGQRIFKPINDYFDQIRMGGAWISNKSTDGAEFQNGADTTAFVEVTFFGTGLNIVGMADSARNYDVTVDGVFLASRTTNGNSSVIRQRGYAQNQVFFAASGLSLGIHTIRLHNLTNARWWGFEILNEAASLKTPAGAGYAGTKKHSLNALNDVSYNSDFEDGAILGSRGGRVVSFIKDGAIKKAYNPVGSQLNIALADHSNEEVTRTYHFREFGCNRADDFSTLVGGTTFRAFTLDDGVTTLTGNSIQGGTEAIELLVNGTGRLQFTFVGTGFDIITDPDSAGSNVVEFYVDAVSIGQFTNSQTDVARIVKVVSGLPYGTHVVTVIRVSATATPVYRGFITYSPKKPSIPDDGVELADYCIMAPFVASTALDDKTPPQGTIRKNAFRETVYSGTWALSSIGTANALAVDVIRTSVLNSYAEFTFVGTGVDLRWSHFNSGGSFTGAVTVDGATNLTAFSPVLTSGDGTAAIAAGTGVITSTGSSGGNSLDHLRLTGMSYGKHTVRITKTSANGVGIMDIGVWEVITLVHSPRYNVPGSVQNNLNVGSNYIGDSRSLPQLEVVKTTNWAQAVGITANPSTTSTAYIPVPEMSAVIKTEGGPIEISYALSAFHTTLASSISFLIYVNGEPVGTEKLTQAFTTNANLPVSDSIVVPVSAGYHIVQLYWQTSAATANLASNRRNLTVKEI